MPTGKAEFAIWQRMKPPKTKLEQELLNICLKLLEDQVRSRSESDVAKDFNVQPSTIGRWLKGERTISLPNVLAVLEKYGMNVRRSQMDPNLFKILPVFADDSEEFDDPKLHELLEMTRRVLRSQTAYAIALEENIRAFHLAVQTAENHERLLGVRGNVANHSSD